MHAPLTPPDGSMLGVTVFDFDGAPDYVERVIVTDYAYVKTPLRPSSGESIDSTVALDHETGTFESTSNDKADNDVIDPRSLTKSQAKRGVQFFFQAADGFIEGTFEVDYHGSDASPQAAAFTLQATQHCAVIRRHPRRSRHSHHPSCHLCRVHRQHLRQAQARRRHLRVPPSKPRQPASAWPSDSASTIAACTSSVRAVYRRVRADCKRSLGQQQQPGRARAARRR